MKKYNISQTQETELLKQFLDSRDQVAMSFQFTDATVDTEFQEFQLALHKLQSLTKKRIKLKFKSERTENSPIPQIIKFDASIQAGPLYSQSASQCLKQESSNQLDPLPNTETILKQNDCYSTSESAPTLNGLLIQWNLTQKTQKTQEESQAINLIRQSEILSNDSYILQDNNKLESNSHSFETQQFFNPVSAEPGKGASLASESFGITVTQNQSKQSEQFENFQESGLRVSDLQNQENKMAHQITHYMEPMKVPKDSEYNLDQSLIENQEILKIEKKVAPISFDNQLTIISGGMTINREFKYVHELKAIIQLYPERWAQMEEKLRIIKVKPSKLEVHLMANQSCDKFITDLNRFIETEFKFKQIELMPCALSAIQYNKEINKILLDSQIKLYIADLINKWVGYLVSQISSEISSEAQLTITCKMIQSKYHGVFLRYEDLLENHYLMDLKIFSKIFGQLIPKLQLRQQFSPFCQELQISENVILHFNRSELNNEEVLSLQDNCKALLQLTFQFLLYCKITFENVNQAQKFDSQLQTQKKELYGIAITLNKSSIYFLGEDEVIWKLLEQFQNMNEVYEKFELAIDQYLKPILNEVNDPESEVIKIVNGFANKITRHQYIDHLIAATFSQATVSDAAQFIRQICKINFGRKSRLLIKKLKDLRSFKDKSNRRFLNEGESYNLIDESKIIEPKLFLTQSSEAVEVNKLLFQKLKKKEVLSFKSQAHLEIFEQQDEKDEFFMAFLQEIKDEKVALEKFQNQYFLHFVDQETFNKVQEYLSKFEVQEFQQDQIPHFKLIYSKSRELEKHLKQLGVKLYVSADDKLFFYSRSGGKNDLEAMKCYQAMIFFFESLSQEKCNSYRVTHVGNARWKFFKEHICQQILNMDMPIRFIEDCYEGMNDPYIIIHFFFFEQSPEKINREQSNNSSQLLIDSLTAYLRQRYQQLLYIEISNPDESKIDDIENYLTQEIEKRDSDNRFVLMKLARGCLSLLGEISLLKILMSKYEKSSPKNLIDIQFKLKGNRLIKYEQLDLKPRPYELTELQQDIERQYQKYCQTELSADSLIVKYFSKAAATPFTILLSNLANYVKKQDNENKTLEFNLSLLSKRFLPYREQFGDCSNISISKTNQSSFLSYGLIKSFILQSELKSTFRECSYEEPVSQFAQMCDQKQSKPPQTLELQQKQEQPSIQINPKLISSQSSSQDSQKTTNTHTSQIQESHFTNTAGSYQNLEENLQSDRGLPAILFAETDLIIFNPTDGVEVRNYIGCEMIQQLENHSQQPLKYLKPKIHPNYEQYFSILMQNQQSSYLYYVTRSIRNYNSFNKKCILYQSLNKALEKFKTDKNYVLIQMKIPGKAKFKPIKDEPYKLCLQRDNLVLPVLVAIQQEIK